MPLDKNLAALLERLAKRTATDKAASELRGEVLRDAERALSGLLGRDLTAQLAKRKIGLKAWAVQLALLAAKDRGELASTFGRPLRANVVSLGLLALGDGWMTEEGGAAGGSSAAGPCQGERDDLYAQRDVCIAKGEAFNKCARGDSGESGGGQTSPQTTDTDGGSGPLAAPNPCLDLWRESVEAGNEWQRLLTIYTECLKRN